tara:strand:- start:2107 stop:4860 length:2754 start_codon:yes stop_codon:yes gene_type:complete
MQIPFDANTSSSQNRLILIDGHAIIHRAFRGISAQGNNLTVSTTGEDVTGVYGFLNIFLRAITDQNPSHCIITFDTPKPTFRHIAFPEYKAQRAETPVELRHQFDRVRQLMETFAVPTFSLDGYEADDLIGTISAQAELQGLETIILTGDRDTFQLISPLTKVDLGSNARDRKLYGEPELIERYGGLTAEQQPDFKALLGDSSDNIPGVPRVGEKRAIGLLNEYGNLEGIYDNLESIHPPSVKSSLTESKEIAFNNRELMTINRSAPITVDFEAALFGGYDMTEIISLLTELEFNSIINRIPGNPVQFANDTQKSQTAPVQEGDYVCVDTQAKLNEMLLSLQKSDKIAFDTETTNLNPMLARLVGLSFSVEPGSAWYVPLGHAEGLQLSMEDTLDQLKPILQNPYKQMCAHNANYDLMILSRYGIDVANLAFDTMIGGHLLGNASLGLKALSQSILGIEMQPITELIGTGKKQITFAEVPIETAFIYASADADCTFQLWQHFQPEIDGCFAKTIMTDIEIPLIPVIIEMQKNGITLEANNLENMSEELQTDMGILHDSIVSYAGHSLNINSPSQLSDVLFNELDLPKTKKTKTGYSTDANSLEFLKSAHPIIEQILSYRELSKLKSTYVDALPHMINPDTHRIHTSYNQTGSITGRISSSEPNLQNIPVRTERGRKVRNAFVAETRDSLLFAADYSQIELRVLAHLSQDPGLLSAFHNGEDIHSSTASLMFDVDITKVDSEMRRIAKVLNFGVIYGLSAHGITQQTGFSREEGNNFIKTYFSKYPGIQNYLEEIKTFARDNGYVQTLMGRRRYVPDIHSSNFNVRSAAERISINMPIQGTAADIMKLAMINVFNSLQGSTLESKILMQVHDELVFEVPIQEIEPLKSIVVAEMPNAMNLDVDLIVETKQGPSWGDME